MPILCEHEVLSAPHVRAFKKDGELPNSVGGRGGGGSVRRTFMSKVYISSPLFANSEITELDMFQRLVRAEAERLDILS